MIERVQTRGMPSRVMVSRAMIEGLLGKTGSASPRQADRAGLLVGRLTSDGDGIIITVSDTVELPDVPLRAEPPGLLIALADDLRRRAKATHAGREIIGWFHTHSGSGVSASEEDAMVHKSLSSLGAGVALIVDSVRQQASFFYMDGEALLPFPGYYMFDPAGESPERSLSGPAAQASHSQAADKLRKCVRLSPVAWLRKLRRLLQRPSSEARSPAAPEASPQARQAIARDNASRPTVKPGTPGTVTVTVAPGESVAVVAKRLYGGATDERMREILAMNGITDPRKIAPGTILVCPGPPAPPPGSPASTTERKAASSADDGACSGADSEVDSGADSETPPDG